MLKTIHNSFALHSIIVMSFFFFFNPIIFISQAIVGVTSSQCGWDLSINWLVVPIGQMIVHSEGCVGCVNKSMETGLSPNKSRVWIKSDY